MADRQVHIEVLTPKGKLFSGMVKFAVLPGIEGPFAVYPMHAPIISGLREGTIRCVLSDGEDKKIEIKGGFAEVSDDRIIVAAEL